jgi:hypothetical protein
LAVLVAVVVLVELAALAIAAPPPTRAPVSATAVRTLRIGIHLLGSFDRTILAVCRSDVGVG